MSSKWTILALVLFSILSIAVWMNVGLFVVQPIGAVPDGATIVYWRMGTTLPFVSSADGLTLKAGQGVSLLSRGLVMAQVIEVIDDRVLFRLPYSRMLYLLSTGGVEFER